MTFIATVSTKVTSDNLPHHLCAASSRVGQRNSASKRLQVCIEELAAEQLKRGPRSTYEAVEARRERIERIRVAIAAGSYRVLSGQLAERLMDSMMLG